MADLEGFRSPSSLAGLPKNTSVLLAFSGGADSCALLDLLAKEAQKDGFSILLAHVNHGIRGSEACRDEAFCAETAKRYGLELCVQKADVPALARAHGRSLEEEGRDVRYAFFADLMQRRQIPILATAHHADDLLETVLFRVARGTGLRGMCGIAPVREFAPGVLVRPLLTVPKKEILAYCRQENLPFVTDSTNRDTHYARNRLRAEAVPVLEGLYPGVARRVAERSAEWREDEAFLSAVSEEAYAKALHGSALRVASLVENPPAIVRRVLERFLQAQAGIPPLHAELSAAVDALRSGNAAWKLPLAEKRILVSEKGFLRVVSPLPEKSEARFPLSVGNFTFFDPEMRVSVEKCPADSRLFWRTPLPGDRILQNGMHKRLVQVWREAAVPAEKRNLLPVLTDGKEILWAPVAGASQKINLTDYQIRISLPAGFRLTENNE